MNGFPNATGLETGCAERLGLCIKIKPISGLQHAAKHSKSILLSNVTEIFDSLTKNPLQPSFLFDAKVVLDLER